MLRRLAKPALKTLLKSQAPKILSSFKPTFSFATGIENVSKLKNIIADQIKYQEQNKQDLSEFSNFFKNQGWSINYNGIQVQLSKKTGLYNLRILFNAKTPIGSDLQPEQGQNQGEQQDQGTDQDLTEVVAYIQKEGNPKWLALDFMVGNSNQAQIVSATFITDYQFEKKQRRSGKIPETGYNGPELSTLEDKVQSSLYDFIQGLGLTGEIFQRAAQFSMSYQHQFYIEWLKDLKSLA